MLTGLTPPDLRSGHHRRRPYAELPNPGRVVGVMLDAAAQHPGRTGLETLRLTALPARRAAAGAPTRCSSGSACTAPSKRRVGNYSLGMRQRLGIGTALLGDPAVLVLDEPANGHGPRGHPLDARAAAATSPPRGGTVLLSSHLLGEVQATVDRLVVIGGGRIVAQGSLDELLARRPRPRRPRSGPRRPARRRCSPPGTPPTGGGRRLLVAPRPEQVGRPRRTRRPGAARAPGRRRRPRGTLLPAHLA